MVALVRRLSLALAVSAALGLAAAPLHAGEVPQTVAHQGRLLDASGSPLNGSHTLTFSLYAAPTGGEAVWSEDQTLMVSGGHYATVLGVENTQLSVALDAGATYVEVSQGDNALLPRQPLTSVPFALRAAVASELAPADGSSIAALLEELTEAAKGPRTWDAHKTDTASVAYTAGWVDIDGLSIEVQPTSVDDSFDIAFYVHAAAGASTSTNQGQPGFRITRNGEVLVVGDAAGNRLPTHASIPAGSHDGHSAPNVDNSMINFTAGRVMDSPNTTETVTYQLQWRAAATHSAVLNRSRFDENGLSHHRPVSSLHVQQVRRMNGN